MAGSGSPRRRGARATAVRFAVVGVALVTVAASCSSSDGGGGAADTTALAAVGATLAPPWSAGPATTGPEGCPTTIDAAAFASADEQRALAADFNAFGLRSPGSDQHEASIDWLASKLAEVPGMTIAWDEYTIDRWQPTPEAPGDAPGRDLGAAGTLLVGTDTGEEEIPVVGAVPFSQPTGGDGASARLVHLPPGEPITAANAAGRIVVREIPHQKFAYSLYGVMAHHVTDDVPSTGDYDRPYARPLDQILVDAGTAGAAGVVLVWDAPTDQLRGYWDPHTGTRFRLPGVYVGQDHADELLASADRGGSARLVVDATWDRAPTRNLIATLPGATRERIVINTNTDSVTWIQENGNIAAIALARYLATLPVECRQRDVQFALTTNHLGFAQDGIFRYAPQIDQDFDAGTVAFVMAIEHLGARELAPTGADGRLTFTGEADLFAWSAPEESPVLVDASIAAVSRRGLAATAVLRGTSLPSTDHVPTVCSQGGLGSVFHSLLVPTIGGGSGPWSLWAPSFGAEAVDFDRLRDQTLAFGDVAVALDDVPRDQIAGTYPEARRRRAAGAETCTEILTPPPTEAPAG